MVTTAETSTALTNTTATPTCPELKVLILELNGLSINEVNETERELTNAKYTKYCFDCDAQMDSCVLVGFYVFSAILIVLKQVIKVVRKRYERHQARKMKRLKEIPVDTEMARISL